MVLSVIFWWNYSNYVAARELPPCQSHVLSRLSFGVTAADLAQVERMGIEAYLQSQLRPQSIKESTLLEKYLAQFGSVNQDPIKLHQYDAALRSKLDDAPPLSQQQEKIQLDIRKFQSKVLNEAADAHMARAIYSRRQLQEVMVDFWFNHFNVHGQKGEVKFWLNEYENEIRTYALGNFYDLLLATAQHPAMLMYLDNKNNIDPDSPVGKKRDSGLNENYARELMELHTLGVAGGYSQDDVIALARILTGWGLERLDKKENYAGFWFYDNRHDHQNKLFLGHQIAVNGVQEGLQALKILANHPATAHYISYELAQYFVADEPPASLVDNLAKTFLETEGNIRLVMDALIHSQEFNDPQYYEQKFQTPYQYLISLVRMGEIQQPKLGKLRGMLFQLSMPTYRCTTPDGYSNTQSAWLNPQAMLQRTSLATEIANGTLNKNSVVKMQKLEQNLGAMSPQTKQVIEQAPIKLRSALMMGSPEAMYR